MQRDPACSLVDESRIDPVGKKIDLDTFLK
jgi:hypothetical protein